MSTEINCPKCDHHFVVPVPARGVGGEQVCAYCRRNVSHIQPYGNEIVCVQCISADRVIAQALTHENPISTAAVLRRRGYIPAPREEEASE